MTNLELLHECKLQFEYLNQKFGETGTTNSLLSKLNQALHKHSIVRPAGGRPSEQELNSAAREYATKMSSAPDKETPDWIIMDFKAGVKWMQNYQAAAQEGELLQGEAQDTVAEGEALDCCNCGKRFNNITLLWAHLDDCAGSSYEGQP